MPPRLPFALLTTLLISCGTPYPVVTPTEPCHVPVRPTPPSGADIAACGDLVCESIETAIAFAQYVFDSTEVELAIARCSLVVRP